MRMKNTVLLGLALAGASMLAGAQSDVDRSFRTTAHDCGAVQWSQRALATYPKIASACQSVEERDGINYVKFQGTVRQVADGGRRLTVDFKDGEQIVLSPPEQTRVYVNGRSTPIEELRRGDELNFYIAENRLAAQFPETESFSARFVVVPIVVPQPAGSEALAATLPATASPLPLFALGGGLMLACAALLTLMRRWR